MKQIIHDFIKENDFKMDSSGLYLIGKGDLQRLLDKQKKQLTLTDVSQQRELFCGCKTDTDVFQSKGIIVCATCGKGIKPQNCG